MRKLRQTKNQLTRTTTRAGQHIQQHANHLARSEVSRIAAMSFIGATIIIAGGLTGGGVGAAAGAMIGGPILGVGAGPGALLGLTIGAGIGVAASAPIATIMTKEAVSTSSFFYRNQQAQITSNQTSNQNNQEDTSGAGILN